MSNDPKRRAFYEQLYGLGGPKIEIWQRGDGQWIGRAETEAELPQRVMREIALLLERLNASSSLDGHLRPSR